MIKGEIKLRVRYVDTDKMGILHHAKYFEYLEVARVELFRKIGLIYAQIEENGIALPVIKASIQYKRAIKYDDIVAIEVEIPSLPKITITLNYIIKVNGEICAIATTTLAFVDIKTIKPIKPPPSILDVFIKNFNSGEIKMNVPF